MGLGKYAVLSVWCGDLLILVECVGGSARVTSGLHFLNSRRNGVYIP